MTEAYGQDNTAFSLFGTVDYHMTDRLTATVGLNYTQDNKDAYGRVVSTDTFSAIDLDPLSPFISQVATGALLLQAGVDPTSPAQIGRPHPVVGSQPFAAGNPVAQLVFVLPSVMSSKASPGDWAATW